MKLILLLILVFLSACSRQEISKASDDEMARVVWCQDGWNDVCEDYPYAENTRITDLTTCEMGKRGYFEVDKVVRAKDANKFCETYLYLKDE